jgi:predicted nucleic acid-binding protein
MELVELQWKLLPVRLHAKEEYNRYFDEALAALEHRDPEDAHVLALAKSLGLPIWTNDRDLISRGPDCYTTAKLLRILDEQAGA